MNSPVKSTLGGVGAVLYNSTGAPDGMDIFFFSDGVRNSKAEFALFVFVLPCTL